MVKVVVTGLAPEEHMFKESLQDACLVVAEKLEKVIKFTPEDELHLQVKSRVEGNKKRYLVNARISVQGRVYAVSESDKTIHREEWDLHLSVKETLEKLKKVVEKHEKHAHLKGLNEEEKLEKRGVVI